MEGTTIPKLLSKHNIKEYFRYVDDIILVHIDKLTNIHVVLDEFNNLTPKLKFTLEEEQNNQINFLDFTIIKNHKGLSFDIYRKPTTTDIIIPKVSCHPNEQKISAIRYYCDRLLTYRLTPENREKEKETVKQILVNNKYNALPGILEHKGKKQNYNTKT
jgi:hypothetical protein